MQTPTNTKAVLDKVLDFGKRAAKNAEIFVALNSERSANTRFAKNQITSTGDVEETEVFIEVAFGKKVARTTSNQLDDGSLKSLVERAIRMAELAPEDPERMPLLARQKYLPAPAALDEAAVKLGAKTRADAAKTAIDARSRTNGDVDIFGFYQHSSGERALGSTSGLRASFRSSEVALGVSARTTDGTGSGSAVAVSHRAADIDPVALAHTAIDKATRSRSPKRLEPGKFTVVLEPEAVAGLLGFLRGQLDARLADEGRSFFAKAGGATKVGEQIFAPSVHFESDPTSPLMPSATFDGTGLPLAPTRWIEGGILRSLSYSRYWAAKQNRAPTGEHDRYLLRGGTAASIDEMVSGVERGLLISRFHYMRFLDPREILITGLTRDGVFLIEKGRVTGPVNNLRFNESPVKMLRNVDLMTKDTVLVQAFPAKLRVPALRTHDFNFTSISDAI